MFKHIFILGFIIMVIGGLLLAWTYHDTPELTEPLPYIVSPNEITKLSPDWPPLTLYEPNELDQSLAQLNNKSEAALILDQQARLQTDISTLAMNDADSNDATLKARLYGENWQQEVQQYKQRSELR